VTWVAPITTGVQAPLGYRVEVFDLPGTGPAIVSTVVGATPLSFQILSASIVADTDYIVKITALYECGESSAVTVQGTLKTLPVAAKLYYTETSLAPISAECDDGKTPVMYELLTNEIRVDLKTTGGTPLINSGSTIEIGYSIEKVGCGGIITTESIVITIPNGNSYGTYEYDTYDLEICDPLIGCEDVSRSVLCFEFARLVGGAPLPVLIELDSSISAMGTCGV
jgi:hypothetical protein